MMESRRQEDNSVDESPKPQTIEVAIPWTAENIEKHVLRFTPATDSTNTIMCAANYGPYPHHLAICDAAMPDTEPKEIVNEILLKLHPGNLDDMILVFRRLAPLVLCERHNHPFELFLTRCRWTWNLAHKNWSVDLVSSSPERGHNTPEESQQELEEKEGKETEGAQQQEDNINIDIENYNELDDDWESWGSDSSTFGYKENRLRMWEDDLWRWQGELQTREQAMKKREKALARKEHQREREEMLRILEGALQSWACSLRTREECLRGRKLEGDLERRRSGDGKEGGRGRGLGLEGWLLCLACGWREGGLSMADLTGLMWFYGVVASFLSVGIWLVWKYL